MRELKSKYYTDKSIKLEIDKLLEENCCNVANSDTGSSKDIGGDAEVESAWVNIQKRIKSIDPEFYESIKSREI